MKPPRYEYHDPEFLEDALDLLAYFGDDSKVLAGGQSLMPLLNLRLARPAHVVDINQIAELRGISHESGLITIKALTTHAAVQASADIAQLAPLLHEAMRHIGHDAIRNRGTIGGSLAHADPSAELPAVMTALDATFTLTSSGGVRRIPARDFFLMPLTTAAQSDELLTSVEFDAQSARSGSAVEELARRRGDFALVGVATTLELDEQEQVERSRVVTFGTGVRPVRHELTEQLLHGRRLDDALRDEIRATAASEVTPSGDHHGSTQYRKTITGVLVDRAIRRAHARARELNERTQA